MAQRVVRRASRVARRVAWRATIGLTAVICRLPFGLRALGTMAEAMMGRRRTVEHRSIRMTFAEPNWLARYRNDTFASKEPGTLDWIDEIPEGATLWDVGANVGLYSIYAARARKCRVVAFEPSVFNLELLARNLVLNGVQDRVTIVPIALNDRHGPSAFQLTTTAWGGASSTFEHAFDHNGRPLQGVFEYRSIGVSMDDAVETLGLPVPEYIKIDVDGIEHVILRGAGSVLSQVRSVQVEVNERFADQADEVARRLADAGLVRQSSAGLGLPWLVNQVWARTTSQTDSGAPDQPTPLPPLRPAT